jgi:hypothetical protein
MGGFNLANLAAMRNMGGPMMPPRFGGGDPVGQPPRFIGPPQPMPPSGGPAYPVGPPQRVDGWPGPGGGPSGGPMYPVGPPQRIDGFPGPGMTGGPAYPVGPPQRVDGWPGPGGGPMYPQQFGGDSSQGGGGMGIDPRLMNLLAMRNMYQMA